MAHIKTYHNHVEKLVKCLPMDDTHFITKLSAQQLLPGDTENKIKPLTTQADKASYFLSHVIKPALDINETSSFDTLLCIMQNCDYIHVQKLAVTIKCEIDKSDNEVKLKNDDLKLQTSESQADETNIQLHKIKLQVDERKSKPVEIKPGANQLNQEAGTSVIDQQQPSIQSNSSDDIDKKICNVNFNLYEDVADAFVKLFTVCQQVIKMSSNEKFRTIKNSCISRAGKPLGGLIKRATDTDGFFEILADNNKYCNWMNISLLSTMAIACGNEHLQALIKDYKNVIYSRTLRDVWNCLPHYPVRGKYYGKLQATFGDKDPDNMTVDELVKNEPQLAKKIAMLIAVVERKSLLVTWLIPTDEVYQTYLSFLTVPQKSRKDELVQFATWMAYPPQNVMQRYEKEIDCEAVSFSTLLTGYYHGLLLRDIDADLLIDKMCSTELLSAKEHTVISSGHTVHQRNLLLLEYVRLMDLKLLLEFCKLLEQEWPEIGSQLITTLGGISLHLSKPKPITSVLSSCQCDRRSKTNVSIVLVLYFHLIDQLGELLQPYDYEMMMEQCRSLKASDHNDIKLFSQAQFMTFSQYESTTLLRMVGLFTWSNCCILKSLVNFCSKAVKLLEKFESSVDPLQPIISYPIPCPSSDMIPSDTSTYTILAVRYKAELCECSLQCIYDIQSVMIEKCDITQHCLQLLAVRSDPTILYWTIPKCVVHLIADNIPLYSEYLYSKRILEVLVYPRLLLTTDADVCFGSQAFDFTDAEKVMGIDCEFELSTHVATTTTVMSERLQRSSRLQDKQIKRTKLAAKVKKKSYRIMDDDSSSDINLTDDGNHSITSNNTSFTTRQQIGSQGGNFTRVYSSYNKETSHAAGLDVYEDDFINDGDDSCYSNSTEEDEVIRGEDSHSDRSMEEENHLHTSFSGRKRKRRLSSDSSSEESSNSDVVIKKKKRPAPKRSSSRAASLKERKEAYKMEKLQELKRTRERKRAGLCIEALEEEEQKEDDSTNEQGATDSEEDTKFVVSDDEIAGQPSDYEHDLHLTLKPSMSTHLFTPDHISEVKEQFLKILKRRKSIDCDELLEVVEEGDFKKIDAFIQQLINFYNNADLNSDVAHLVLQLAICYGHSTLVEPLILQYKIDVNRPDRRGIFPLTLAAAYGHCDCFKILLDRTKLQSILSQHPTLLHVAIEAALSNKANNDSCYYIMKLLFEERREFFDEMMSSKTHPTVVEMIIWYGRVMCLTFLLENCTEVLEIPKNNSEEFPPSLIILAVCSPHQQEIGNNLILQLLLKYKIGNINMSDNRGWTGLMWSTYYRNTDCMLNLLDHHATVYCHDKLGRSCLHIAALLGATKCAQLLINYHHPVDCTDKKGWPPLLYANFSSERECVLTIMKAKPNQLLMLGNLLEKSYDVESEAKQKTYLQVQKVLEAVAQHEAYYALFNQFICDNPDILMEDGDSTFLQKCKDLLDFNNKKKWFYKMLEKFATPSDYRGDYYDYTTLHDINRESVMLTAYRRLRYTSASSLRMHFSVTFRNEPGVAAGPRREFWSCFSQDVVKKDHHLFRKCDNSHYTFTANEILKQEKHHKCFIGDKYENNLDLLKFIGKMLAVAVNHKDIISFRLTHPILKMLLGTSLVHPDDMEATDGEYYQKFQSLDGDISDLGLSFSDLLCCPMCGKNETFDLRTNNIDQNDVTESNKEAFIKAVSVFKLENSIEEETESFLKGFWEVIPVEYLRIFTPDQFSLLLSGIPTIDVDDWEQNTEYYGSSSEDSVQVIGWFWSLVRSLAEEEKALLLKFCTGSPRVPAGGFAKLEGLSGLTKFRISFASGEDRVPEASTCFNNLRLSHYTNEQQCRDKILIVIRFGCEGFSFG